MYEMGHVPLIRLWNAMIKQKVQLHEASMFHLMKTSRYEFSHLSKIGQQNVLDFQLIFIMFYTKSYVCR